MKPESEIIIKFSLTLKEENVLVLMYGNLMANIKRTIKEGALDIQLGKQYSVPKEQSSLRRKEMASQD
jgi:hypothetical protein